MSRPARTLVLGDLHLTRQTPRAVSDDLACLLASHPGERVVFAGDLFDLSAESPKRPHEGAMRDVLAHHAAAGPALARHLDGGGELWLVGGNHDADVAIEVFRDAFRGALGVSSESSSRVRWSPWFFREGAVHIEHGHLYDPDNAPAHPLVVGEPSLGVHFVEEFIAPTGAFAYLNTNDQTPLKLFLSSFTLYGPRAPHVIYRYFYAAFAAMLRSGPFYRARSEARQGEERTARFAEQQGLPLDLVEAIAPGYPTVTLGIRPGEKLHEEMISPDDSHRTFRQDDRYVVTPTLADWGFTAVEGEPVPDGFSYRSDTNDMWMTAAELRAILGLG